MDVVGGFPLADGTSCQLDLDMDIPAARFLSAADLAGLAAVASAGPDRTGGDWVSRRVCSNGIVSCACPGSRSASAVTRRCPLRCPCQR